MAWNSSVAAAVAVVALRARQEKKVDITNNNILCFWGDFSLRIEISRHSARHPVRIFDAHLLGGV